MKQWRSIGLEATLVANLLIFGVLAYVAVLETSFPDFYYASLQEDEYLEWATFWAFVGAMVMSLVTAARQRRLGNRLPWFALGVAAFCFFVAMEEISWAHRVFGYRAPTYLLQENFQLVERFGDERPLGGSFVGLVRQWTQPPPSCGNPWP